MLNLYFSSFFCRGVPKLKKNRVCFIGASAIKSWEKSRIFKYGLPIYFLNKGQKPMASVTIGRFEDGPGSENRTPSA